MKFHLFTEKSHGWKTVVEVFDSTAKNPDDVFEGSPEDLAVYVKKHYPRVKSAFLPTVSTPRLGVEVECAFVGAGFGLAISDELKKKGRETNETGRSNMTGKKRSKKVEVMTEEEYIRKVTVFRNKVVALNKEAEKLGKEGESIRGAFTSVDFDGDEHDTHDNLGDAFECTQELDAVVEALYHFINGGYKSDEDNEDEG